jgi:hypothetical protein
MMAIQKLSAAFRPGTWRRRLAVGAAVSTALFALIGFLVVPPIAKHVAQKQLGELLGRKVTIARVRVNPFALSVTIADFQIFEADQTTPFVGFRRLYVNAQLSSIYRRAPVIKELGLDGLRIRAVRLQATPDAWADTAAYNFSDILARMAARPAEPPSPDTGTPRFSLNNIRITDAAISFEDRPLGSRHEVTELAVGVPFVSTLPVYLDSFVEPGLTVKVDGTPFAIAGRTKPFKDSLETLLEVRLDALDLTKYVQFVPLRLPFSVESARLTLALDLSFLRPRVDAPSVRLRGRVALDGLDVREKRAAGPRPLASFTKLEIAIGDSDVTTQRFQVDRVLLSGLDAHVRRLPDGSLNLEHLAPTGPGPRGSAPAAPPRPSARAGATSEGPRFSVGTFTLEKAAVHFRDESVRPAFEADVRDIAVSVSGLSNAPGVTARVKAGLRAVPGGALTQQGTLRLTPLAASGVIAIEGIEPGHFGPYMHDRLAFDVANGRLRLGAHYLFEQGKTGQTVRITDGLVELSELALRRRDAREDFFRMADFAVHGAALDLGRRTVSVEAVTTRDARVRASRDGNGVVDLSTLVTTPSPGPAPAAPVAPAPRAEPAWTVGVERIDLERWGVRFEDRAVSPKAVSTLDPVTLHVTKLSTAPDTRFGVDLRVGINKSGRLTVTGTTGLDPQAAALRFDLRALELLPLQPYFRDQVGLTVTSGAVSVKGQVGMTMSKGKGGAKPDPQVDLGADIEVADLATVDRDKQEALVKWKSFHVAGLRMSNHPAPIKVAIDEVALTDLDAHLIMFPDGRLNLEQALAAPSTAAPSGAGASKGKHDANTPATAASSNDRPPQITIGRVTIQQGGVTYTDRGVQPHYTADVSELGARISGLSSTAGTTAEVDLRATVNRSGSLAIAGKTNPLAKDLFVDVQVALKDVELPPASPYSGKFAGYAISKGKLELALDYKIANRKVDANNKLILDQFTFGDKVDSPDAVKAPVRLAVALLRDRRGVIDIDLPISGSLDDPKFKVWPAILKVVGTLLVKAATAPFSLIAAAFGGGDELSRIDFAAGASTLDASAQRKLRSLGEALQQRPGLSLEIEGAADLKQDRDGLRRFSLERKLKAQKLAELVQEGAPTASLDQVQIDTADRPRLLQMAYKAETFAKPKNALGFEKSLPPSEMERLMLENARVEDDDLRALALRRATAFQASLAKTAPSAAGRLFLVAPRLGSTGGRVELKLKKD